MWNTVTIVAAAVLALCLSGCAGNQTGSIMQATPGDPTGSANTGTGSVTTNSTISPEAKAAGIGLGP